ncbi:MAG TPA: TIGR03084 family metal-binding protein [Thermomonospora sp.]|nr:TIGR03084 family metal-binding protein [Thermomonospora sp.]
MPDPHELIADLAAEGAALDALVAPLAPAAWATPTPAEGWTVAHQIAHLAWTDRCALTAATDEAAFAEMVAGFTLTIVDDAAAEGAKEDPAALLHRWRNDRQALAEALLRVPRGQKLPWFGPPMSAASMATARIMETWAHGLDVADALNVTVEPTPRIRHVAHIGVRARDFAFHVHGLTPPADPFRVVLTAPDGQEWIWGPEDAPQSVTGPALDFCLLATQRRHRDDLTLVAHGPDADHWLTIAQTFAGPPGPGRTPSAD